MQECWDCCFFFFNCFNCQKYHKFSEGATRSKAPRLLFDGEACLSFCWPGHVSSSLCSKSRHYIFLSHISLSPAFVHFLLSCDMCLDKPVLVQNCQFWWSIFNYSTAVDKAFVSASEFVNRGLTMLSILVQYFPSPTANT